jgi:hypothetical protein
MPGIKLSQNYISEIKKIHKDWNPPPRKDGKTGEGVISKEELEDKEKSATILPDNIRKIIGVEYLMKHLSDKDIISVETQNDLPNEDKEKLAGGEVVADKENLREEEAYLLTDKLKNDTILKITTAKDIPIPFVGGHEVDFTLRPLEKGNKVKINFTDNPSEKQLEKILSLLNAEGYTKLNVNEKQVSSEILTKIHTVFNKHPEYNLKCVEIGKDAIKEKEEVKPK